MISTKKPAPIIIYVKKVDNGAAYFNL